MILFFYTAYPAFSLLFRGLSIWNIGLHYLDNILDPEKKTQQEEKFVIGQMFPPMITKNADVL